MNDVFPLQKEAEYTSCKLCPESKTKPSPLSLVSWTGRCSFCIQMHLFHKNEPWANEAFLALRAFLMNCMYHKIMNGRVLPS